MAPLYRPPTRVTTREFPFLALVSQADPDFQRRKHREIEYEFQNRVFVGDPINRGAYNRLSSIYPVGQPQGTTDPLITAALTTTAGNSSPGLYTGTPDGKGWA